ncbi:MAG TPA: TIGR04282 family arsenosugar biosynthesis glycosyltransferase [Gemmatimonadales bacterium]|nr:TIGR04282 family arsenosugar biosynthesis glycosyltransferase [Gemmatimonadales bacterium]
MTVPDVTAVIVFARAPRPGAVKTRLMPLLGAEGAAALHAQFVERTLTTAQATSLHPIELHCAPDTNDLFFQFCAEHYGITVKPQVEGDLGGRMWSAFRQALTAHARVLLVGSDCPALTPRHLRQAETALRDGADAVFVPCEDGGYGLIGLTRVDGMLFDGIAWGGTDVMAQTRARLQTLGWTWRELETLWDVDRPEDYQRLVESGLLDTRRAAMMNAE